MRAALLAGEEVLSSTQNGLARTLDRARFELKDPAHRQRWAETYLSAGLRAVLVAATANPFGPHLE